MPESSNIDKLMDKFLEYEKMCESIIDTQKQIIEKQKEHINYLRNLIDVHIFKQEKNIKEVEL